MRTPRKPGSPSDEDGAADGGRANERLKQFEQQRGLPPRKRAPPASPSPLPVPPLSPKKKR